MRQPSPSDRLSVELSAEVWREIGALSGEEFSALRQQLEVLATSVEGERVARFRIGRLSGTCERDLLRGTLRVIRLQREG